MMPPLPLRYYLFGALILFVLASGGFAVHSYNKAVGEREQYRAEAEAAKKALADIEVGVVRLKTYYSDREKRQLRHVNTVKVILSERSQRDDEGNIDPATDPVLRGLNGMFANRTTATTADHP